MTAIVPRRTLADDQAGVVNRVGAAPNSAAGQVAYFLHAAGRVPDKGALARGTGTEPDDLPHLVEICRLTACISRQNTKINQLIARGYRATSRHEKSSDHNVANPRSSSAVRLHGTIISQADPVLCMTSFRMTWPR